MPDSVDGKVKIAVLEEQIKGIRAQHKEHSDNMEKSITQLSTDMKDVLAAVNKSRGAIWGFSLAGGLLGSLAIKLTTKFFN